MTFLQPTYLWALLGILIPVAIHLWSRKKVVTIKVGSTQLLNASEPKRTSTIRPNEWWLLLLRILIIGLLAFVLAGPHLTKEEKRTPLTYLIEPSLLSSPNLQRVLDTVPFESKRVLAQGFPQVTDYDIATADLSVPHYWQLAQKIQALPTDSIVVFTKALVSGVRGMRPGIPGNIKWMVLDSEEEANAIVEASRRGDSVSLITATSDSKLLAFSAATLSLNNEKIEVNAEEDSVRIDGQRLPIRAEEALKVLLISEDSLSENLQYLRKAYSAISKYLGKPIEVKLTDEGNISDLKSSSESYRTTIWMDSSKVEFYRPDFQARNLIVPGASKNSYYLSENLNSENVIAAHLPEKLLDLLGRHENLYEKINPYDKRVMDAEEIRPVLNTTKTTERRPELFDLSPWMWILLFLILVTERILAKMRKQ
ncbi:MAG: BatA domain-containing protein [Pricia sp.]